MPFFACMHFDILRGGEEEGERNRACTRQAAVPRAWLLHIHQSPDTVPRGFS